MERSWWVCAFDETLVARYTSREQAEEAAKDKAERHPGVTFVVLEPSLAFCSPKVEARRVQIEGAPWDG